MIYSEIIKPVVDPALCCALILDRENLPLHIFDLYLKLINSAVDKIKLREDLMLHEAINLVIHNFRHDFRYHFPNNSLDL